MLTTDTTPTPVRALVQAWLDLARQFATANHEDGIRRLKVFVDCESRFENELKSDATFVQYVDDLDEADVYMTVKPDASHGSARYVRFIGAGPFAFIEASARLHSPDLDLAAA